MGTETEYDDAAPVNFHQQAGARSAQRWEVHIGERSLAMVSRSSFINGLCLALTAVATWICCWAITENRVTQSKLDHMSALQEAHQCQVMTK